jgi:hypothetical protein
MANSLRPTTNPNPSKSIPTPVERQQEEEPPTAGVPQKVLQIENDPPDESLTELEERWRISWVGDSERWSLPTLELMMMNRVLLIMPDPTTDWTTVTASRRSYVD